MEKKKANFVAYWFMLMLLVIIVFAVSYKFSLLNWIVAPFAVIGFMDTGFRLANWLRK